eukprot:11182581-Lingulodinium_polyedra.AAC.1
MPGAGAPWMLHRWCTLRAPSPCDRPGTGAAAPCRAEVPRATDKVDSAPAGRPARAAPARTR